VLWERRHGRPKRVALIADAIVRSGWAMQQSYRNAPDEAPRLTEDVVMVLVNEDLVVQGSAARCDRDDVRAALGYLESPLVRRVERLADGSAVVTQAML
jgi:hypothetical protein